MSERDVQSLAILLAGLFSVERPARAAWFEIRKGRAESVPPEDASQCATAAAASVAREHN